jgi:hypothetical protein
MIRQTARPIRRAENIRTGGRPATGPARTGSELVRFFEAKLGTDAEQTPAPRRATPQMRFLESTARASYARAGGEWSRPTLDVLA